MPHVEVRGPVRLADYHARFAPREWPGGTERTVIRAAASFLAHDQRSLLVDVTVVEGFLRQAFFILLTERDGGAMVRLLPRTAPEKTCGVRQSVAWIASWLREGLPEASIGTTNLAEYLDA